MGEDESARHCVSPDGLIERVHATSKRAHASGALVPLDTEVRLVPDGGVTFLVRVSPNVRHKQAAVADNSPRGDPFAPPYETDLYVGDISDTHVALLNKFNVLDDHVLLVTREYAEQTTMLGTADFEALLVGLAGMDGLAFYNGGTEAGASQPHKHLQLVPIPLAPQGPALPFADLLERARLADRVGHVPELPFRHAVAPMRAEWIENPVRHAADARTLAERLWHYLGHDPHVEHQPVPYNLLATRRWIWLVPRTQDQYEGLPVNALAFAGGLLAPDEAAFGRLCNLGPMSVLEATAEPRTPDPA